MYIKVLLLLAVGLAAVTSELTKEEGELANALENAPFVDDSSAIAAYDEDSEEDGARSIFSGWKEKLKRACGCHENKQCGCCGKLKIFPGVKIKACLNVTIIPEDKAFHINVRIMKNQLVNRTFSAKRLERICDRLPGKLDKVKLCLYTTLTESVEEGLLSCTSLDFIIFDKTCATLKFNCLQFKDNKLKFEVNEDTERDSIMKVKIKNPIKGVMNLFKKKNKEENEEKEEEDQNDEEDNE